MASLTVDEIMAKFPGSFYIPYEGIRQVEVDARKISLFTESGYGSDIHASFNYCVTRGVGNDIFQKLSFILGERLIVNAPLLLLGEFCDYLNNIGFKAEVANFIEKMPETGLVRLKGNNFNYIAKSNGENSEDSYFMYYIEGVQKKIKETKMRRKSGRVDYSGDKALSASLDRDVDLKLKLTWLEIKQIGHKIEARAGNYGYKWVYEKKGEKLIQIYAGPVERRKLPSKELLDAIDTVAQHIRELN